MKTSNLLKGSLSILITLILIVGLMEYIAKKDLKTCESRQSPGCPRFTCPGSNKTCGHRPWICPSESASCEGNEICIGFCDKDEKNCLA
tara:strand:+ start:594 stop:860 length:267 start_codon:yes stop_codon:yes gene_type:complete